MNSQQQTLSLISGGREDILQWQPDQILSDQVMEVLIYVTNELKKKYQTNILEYKDHSNIKYTLQQIIETNQQKLSVELPDQDEVWMKSTDSPASFQYVYNISKTQLKVDKFRNQKKSESTIYEYQTIKNLNKQYKETYEQFLTKQALRNKQTSQEENSPTFGGLNKKSQESGNDGKSQAQFLNQQNPKQKSNSNQPISMEEVNQHKSENDVWTVFNGKVYDITNYIKYHPGGKKIMLGAGTDCSFLFNQYHPWVNGQYLLQKYELGYLMTKK